MLKVDLNSDLGESFGTYKLGMDEEILKYVSSANIACGWHAGDPLIMEKTVKIAVDNNVAIGAHPGLPDLMGFGRRNMSISLDEARTYIKYQVGALMAFANAHNVRLQHVKPHGALYNMAAKDYNLAVALCEGVRQVDKSLVFMGLANSQMEKAAKSVGIPFAAEVFADRGVLDDGTLVPRNQEGAMIHDADIAIKRVIKMIKEGIVESINGKAVPIKADSVCVHGDNPQAIEFVKKIKSFLEKEGIKICKLDF